MKKNFLSVISLALMVSCQTSSQTPNQASDYSIIPKPKELRMDEGQFKVENDISIVASSQQAQGVADFLEDLIEDGSNIDADVEISDKQQKKAINLVIDPAFTPNNKEAYTLDVTPNMVTIRSGDSAGLFYGVQSLRQLMPASIENSDNAKANDSFTIPAVSINDEPRFAWRGYMKDVSRTFFGVDVIKKYLDVMALYKLNVFHFHLTDDQGWRLEIKKYPELTSKQTTTYPEQYKQPSERSGYFTQEQIKDLVKYAADRGITIVPEIDVPGHSWATLLVRPELGVNQNHTPSHVFPFLDSWGHWGNQFTPNSLDPTKEVVYEFLDDIFTEVAELFPSEYIHFGGDEVMHSFWLKEPHVKRFMKQNNMDDVHQLQNYFVKRVAEIIVDKGRKPIGWNDVLADTSLTKQTAIMCWLGEDAITKAANNGYYSVATPSYPLYFDISQNDRNDGTMCDLNYGVINNLEAIYNYNPTQGVSKDGLKYVLGVQANMWPAVPQEVKDINVQNFPRMLGLAEIAWSSEDGKDFAEFIARIENNKKRLDALKVDYFEPGGYIVAQWKPQDISTEYQTKEWDVTDKVYASGRVIAGFYTVEGENPLEIEMVELLKDGESISIDEHYAKSPVKKNIFRPYNYDLRVEEYEPGAKYTLRAKIKGSGSSGNVTFNLSPFKPFTVVNK